MNRSQVAEVAYRTRTSQGMEDWMWLWALAAITDLLRRLEKEGKWWGWMLKWALRKVRGILEDLIGDVTDPQLD